MSQEQQRMQTDVSRHGQSSCRRKSSPRWALPVIEVVFLVWTCRGFVIIKIVDNFEARLLLEIACQSNQVKASIKSERRLAT